MRTTANRYLTTANPLSPHQPQPSSDLTAHEAAAMSPILSIDRDGAEHYAERYPVFEPHSHPEPMLVWASTATFTMTTGSRDWLVPPAYGLWVPADVEHCGAALRAGELCVVKFNAARCPISWTEPIGVAIGPLLGELILHLARVAPDEPGRQHAEALVFELLHPLPTNTIHVPMPTDPRVRIIAEQLIADPADQRELAVWASQVHAGIRTLTRLFIRETGMSFTQWRTHVRIRAAADHLATGTSVNATARAVGYHKPSAFIAAFQRLTGQTPGMYARLDPARQPLGALPSGQR